MDGDVEVGGDVGEAVADVSFGAEPELVAVGEARGEGLDDEQPAGAVAGADGGGLVEQRAGVEDLEDLGVRIAWRSGSGSRSRMPVSWPVPGWWMRCRSRKWREAGRPMMSSSGSPAGQSPSMTSTARYSSITNTTAAGQASSSVS
ncbi:MAG: hypothetical protein ACRDZN_06155 [Acidimicrobiales bacterium]